MTNEEEQTTDLVPVEMELVSPVALEKIVATFRAFERMKTELLTDADWQRIGPKAYITKSGWLKIALACNISLEKREERVEKEGDEIIFHYTYRAIAPSGRFADADGSASSDEKNYAHIPHDVRTLAQTRACNRAISNLAGGGEVSFEEMTPATGQGDAATVDLDVNGIVDALESAGLDTEELDISIDLEGVATVKPKKFLGEHWESYKKALWPIGLSWVKAENQWKGRAQTEASSVNERGLPQ